MGDGDDDDYATVSEEDISDDDTQMKDWLAVASFYIIKNLLLIEHHCWNE